MAATYEFKIDKECKHSRRYAAIKEEACPIKTVYMERNMADGHDTFFITIKLTKEE